ncbi:MAG: hypothetical protein FWB93_05265 [Oscillospiraceae bacterium]|nr:hypothetical protein [Oscillospiraceae bacterium]
MIKTKFGNAKRSIAMLIVVAMVLSVGATLPLIGAAANIGDYAIWRISNEEVHYTATYVDVRLYLYQNVSPTAPGTAGGGMGFTIINLGYDPSVLANPRLIPSFFDISLLNESELEQYNTLLELGFMTEAEIQNIPMFAGAWIHFQYHGAMNFSYALWYQNYPPPAIGHGLGVNVINLLWEVAGGIHMGSDIFVYFRFDIVPGAQAGDVGNVIFRQDLTQFMACSHGISTNQLHFDGNSNGSVTIYGDPVDPPDAVPAYITKHLVTPVGTTVPTTMTFMFDTQFIAWNETPAANIPTGITHPVLSTTASPITISMTSEYYVQTLSPPNSPAGTVTRVFRSDDILEGVTFPGTGMFEFIVTERPNTFTLTQTDALYETLIYSDSVFLLRVFNAFCRDSEEYYIRMIQVVDITDIELGVDEITEDDKPAAGMVFTNVYTRRYANALTVTKTVTGMLRDVTLPFEFFITATLDGIFEITNFTGRIYNANNQYQGTVTFTNGVPNAAGAVMLRDGWRIELAVPVGTQFAVVETIVAPYEPSWVVSGTPYNVTGTTNNTGTHSVLAGGSTAAFTNYLPFDPPTGLTIGSASAIGLVVLAVIALGAFVAVKAKKVKA